jgi:hypothetical protein
MGVLINSPKRMIFSPLNIGTERGFEISGFKHLVMQDYIPVARNSDKVYASHYLRPPWVGVMTHDTYVCRRHDI